MHQFIFFLDNTANFMLNLSFVETHPPSPWMSNTLFERLFLPDKMSNYETSPVVSHKHEFFITTEHVPFPDNIQHFL